MYSPAALATAINTLTYPYNITCTCNATTQFFTFTDLKSATIFTNLNASTCLINLGFSAVQNWPSVAIPTWK